MRFHYYTGMPWPAINGEITVGGSNYRGVHGAGWAKIAHMSFGLLMGFSEGLCGSAYAIPTKDKDLKSLPLKEIKQHVDNFIDFAHRNPQLKFFVTPVGTGLAGYKAEDIAPMFVMASNNCVFSIDWKPYLEQKRH